MKSSTANLADRQERDECVEPNPSSSDSASDPESTMSSATFVDRIDPFAKLSLKKKSKKSQGSSRYRNSVDVELQQLPQLKG